MALMKTVLLLRHAKSDWTHQGLSDKERPLAKRGIKAAPNMGKYIARHKIEPDIVICSPARRTQQTCVLALEKLSTVPEIIINDALYDFSGEGAYLDAIRNTPEKAEIVMLVGHNPTMYYLAQLLTGAGDLELRAEMAAKFPTAALAVMTFDVNSWNEVAPGGGVLVDYAKPRTLDS
ncbi:MAG: SixA phosphatase family protein [Hyphomicrobiales bacterium]